MEREQVKELLLQALETELGGVEVYAVALECAVDAELRSEWQECLRQTGERIETLRVVMERLGIDPEDETPGRDVVRELGESLVEVIHRGREAGDPAAAQLVAAECVNLVETKDHRNWELIGRVARAADAAEHEPLLAAHRKVEERANERYRNSAGWARELWIQSLGLPAVLPPPEQGDPVTRAARARMGTEKHAPR
jgi:hypothetical protein